MKFRCYYLDLYSGSGANNIPKYEIKTIGSPILSILRGIFFVKKNNANRRFDKWFFIEKDSNLVKGLEKRLNITIDIAEKEFGEKLSIGNEVNIHQGDCESEAITIMNNIDKDEKTAFLAFIDPFSLRYFEWQTLKEILKNPHVDVMFTLPTSSFIRNRNRYTNLMKHIPPLSQKHKSMLDKGLANEDWLSSVFSNGISREIKAIVRCPEPVIVRNLEKNTELYRINLYTRSFAGPKIASNVANELNKIRPEHIATAIKKIQGIQKGLGDCPS